MPNDNHNSLHPGCPARANHVSGQRHPADRVKRLRSFDFMRVDFPAANMIAAMLSVGPVRHLGRIGAYVQSPSVSLRYFYGLSTLP